MVSAVAGGGGGGSVGVDVGVGVAQRRRRRTKEVVGKWRSRASDGSQEQSFSSAAAACRTGAQSASV